MYVVDIHIWISIYGYPYMDIHIWMLFGHETSFILRYGHQSGTIRIRKPFSIILDDQNQVPIGPNRGLYQNFEFFEKNHQTFFFYIVWGCFLGT